MEDTWKQSEDSGLADTRNLPLRPWREYHSHRYGLTLIYLFNLRTLFWGGDAFAPKLKLRNKHGEEVSAQQFLQDAFLDMFEVLARAVGDLEGVIGFEVSLSWFSVDNILTRRLDDE